ncbi:hypothetical protein HanPSC8_Chr08g0322811 [Helianthus annuus]|nr:hypothetical protein HanPSC8_Chr08g0322811 [Helianthus annuus]
MPLVKTWLCLSEQNPPGSTFPIVVVRITYSLSATVTVPRCYRNSTTLLLRRTSTAGLDLLISLTR